MSLRPFHLAFPVHDLAAARRFYGETMGCPEGRSSAEWVDFDFYGHQIVAHLAPGEAGDRANNHVDGHGVPVPHFGVVLAMADWQALAERPEAAGTEFLLPQDALCADDFAPDANTAVHRTDAIPGTWMGLDIGPESRKRFVEAVLESRTILWNGPMGVFEMEAFAGGTNDVAAALAKVTANHNAFTLIGGGDSVAAINKAGLAGDVSYVSTGGGAMLEVLEGKALPGIAAIDA